MVSLFIDITMDREIQPEHYIVPGEFELAFDDGRAIRFDFRNSCRRVSDDKRSAIVNVYGLDTLAFPDAELLPEYLANHSITAINEIYIYCGEPYDKPIRVKAIDRMVFDITDDHGFRTVAVPEELLSEYSKRRDCDA